MSEVLLQTKNLKKYFKLKKAMLHAVDDVNISINKGRTLGVVGESGCGKTTLGRVILGLLESTDGEILFEGRDITKMSKKQNWEMRKEMQIIFQDPYSSLNPRHSVAKLIGEPLLVNKIITNPKARREKVLELMKTVGLDERFYDSYPHELDGGRRQRIGIARALAPNPKFIVCDEPVSALDVSIQAQILNLLMDLQDSLDLTYMFITHNLSVVRHISDDIAVLYLGQCVEQTTSDKLFDNPLHPYTKILLSSIPIPSAEGRNLKRKIIKGEITSPVNPKPGCRFHLRCPDVKPECTIADIPLKEVEKGHFVACCKY